MSQFKSTNWWSLSLHKLFLRVRSIIFFMIYPHAFCIACMFTRLKSRDRDRDVISSSPRRDRDVEPSRPRRDRDVQPSRPRRDVPKKRLETASRPRRETETFQKNVSRFETAVSQFKNTNWWSLSLHKLFFACQIHYFLQDISASVMHCMHVHKSKVTRPRPRRYIFKTETLQKNVSRPPRDRDARPRRSKKSIETAVSQFKNTN